VVAIAPILVVSGQLIFGILEEWNVGMMGSSESDQYI
jgi:hypothetical protein